MDREQAVEWLRSVGRIDASARDWAMGTTIVIPVGEPDLGEISVYPGGVVWLRLVESGAWELIDGSKLLVPGPMVVSETYADLESAVRGAHDYVTRLERELRDAATRP